MQLRHELQASDAETIQQLLRATGFFRDDETAVALELVAERLSKGGQSGYDFVVAELDKELVGYCCFGQIPCTLGSYDLYWIAVDPRRQRAGIGRALLSAAERRIAAVGGRRIYIETSGRDLYRPTRDFYLRCGYDLAATLPDFYDTGDAKLILCRAVGLNLADSIC